jgi:hypothetical protein
MDWIEAAAKPLQLAQRPAAILLQLQRTLYTKLQIDALQ